LHAYILLPQIGRFGDALLAQIALGRFYATGIPKMQSQKCNFIILQLQDFLVNYGLYKMLIPFGFYI
jgi:hypothetical protein